MADNESFVLRKSWLAAKGDWAYAISGEITRSGRPASPDMVELMLRRSSSSS
jgi:hypothetical protein